MRGKCAGCGKITFQPCAFCGARANVEKILAAPKKAREQAFYGQLCEACGERHPQTRISLPLSAHRLVAEAFEDAANAGRSTVTFGNAVLFKHFVHEARELKYYRRPAPSYLPSDAATKGDSR